VTSISADAGPRTGSLCTGFGGLDDAVLDVFGGHLAWYCQYDPDDQHQYAAQIMARHAPGVPNLGDITAADYDHAEPVDILTAGWPCQDMSLAGKRAGLIEGNRSGLWFHVARAIRSLRPNLVILENVRGLLSAPADSDVELCPWCMGDAGDGEHAMRALGVVLADLAELGFDAEWQGLPASDVGACHQRFRIFILAWPADPASTGRTREGLSGRTAEHGPAAPDADDLRGDGRSARAGQAGRQIAAGDAPADADGDPLRHQPIAVGRRGGEAVAGLAGTEASAHPDGRGLPQQPERDREPHSGEADDVRHEPDAVRRDAPDADPGPAAHTTGDGRLQGRPEPTGQQGRPDTAVGGQPDWGQYADAITRWETVLGRPAPGPVDDRGRLNPQFVEWMQGLGEGHVTGLPDIPRTAQLKALGNGVVPQQAAAAIRLLHARAVTQ
jgi:DNA (cytosine-5)-methyltransferase 1